MRYKYLTETQREKLEFLTPEEADEMFNYVNSDSERTNPRYAVSHLKIYLFCFRKCLKFGIYWLNSRD